MIDCWHYTVFHSGDDETAVTFCLEAPCQGNGTNAQAADYPHCSRRALDLTWGERDRPGRMRRFFWGVGTGRLLR